MRAEPSIAFPDLLSQSRLSQLVDPADPPAFGRDVPIVSVHLPKTAGTAFADYLFRVLPEPFAIPAIVTSRPPSRSVRDDAFG